MLNFEGLDRVQLIADFQRMLSAVVDTAQCAGTIAERREQFLSRLGELIDADMGFWSWGRGHPQANSVIPLAMIEYRLTDEAKQAIIEFGMTPACTEAHLRMVPHFDDQQLLCVTRQQIFDDETWHGRPPYRNWIEKFGMNSFMMTVRYSADNTWSNFFLLRRAGAPEFGTHERALARAAMLSVSWLHSTEEQPAPDESVATLTPRERTVALLLLDGLSRKQIAAKLELSEHTIGDYAKSLYRRLNVHSLNELAAKMLKNH